MAMLDAVLCPEWQFRYYSFRAAWDVGEQMGSMRDGEGDDFFAHFSPIGCWLKGFAHESPMTPYRENPPRLWPGVLDAVPSEFKMCVEEPAFNSKDTTFCVWRRYSDNAWRIGPIDFPTGHPDPDGSKDLLSPLDGAPGTYLAWASEYYGRDDLRLTDVEHVYQHSPLTAEMVARLNPDLSLAALASDAIEIGYPSASEEA